MASARAGDDVAADTGDVPATVGDEKVVQVDKDKVASQLINDARLATEKEGKMTLLQGIKLYPKAIAWSVLISTTIVMEGYDVALINNFYGFPQFNKKYGEQLPSGEYQVTAPWQSGLSNVRTLLAFP